MREFLTEFLYPLLGLMTALLVLLIAAAILLNATIGPKQCSNYEQVTGRDTQWRFFGGCFVQGRDKWYTMDEYKSVIAAKESLTIEEME